MVLNYYGNLNYQIMNIYVYIHNEEHGFYLPYSGYIADNMVL